MAPAPPRRATWRMGSRERLTLNRVAVALILLLLFVAVRPYILNTIQGRDFQTCQTNCRKMSQGITMYMQLWDDALPPAEGWSYDVQGNMAATSGTGFSVQSYFHCPRDHAGRPSSYAYNDLLSGVSLSLRPQAQGRPGPQAAIARPERAPLIIERHGSEINAHLPLPDWDAVARSLTRPHDVPPSPAGSVILGSGRVTSRNGDELSDLQGRKF